MGLLHQENNFFSGFRILLVVKRPKTMIYVFLCTVVIKDESTF